MQVPPRRRTDIGVTQDRCQRSDVAMVLCQKARREAMAQHVRRHAEPDPCPSRRLRHYPLHIAGIQRAMSPAEE